jgi:predicted ATPase
MTHAGIRTPDQRLRVFISSTLKEMAPERAAVRAAVEALHLAPVMFELGARPHPPRALYRSYLEQSDIFVGLYADSYGWVAPDEQISGLEDEYRLSGSLPALLYVRSPAPSRDERLSQLLDRIREDDRSSYRSFETPEELGRLVADDLALLLADRFVAPTDHLADADAAALGAGIPSPYNAIIGRAREHDAVVALVDDPQVRIVTLVGPGGIGKSRLAIDVAQTVAASGRVVAFTLLESVTRPEEVLHQIATALDVRDSGEGDLVGTVSAALADRHALLVLDNMEQLRGATELLVHLITAVPTLTLLVTSRSPLHVRAERIVEVGPLDVFDAGSGTAAAVALFAERAAAVHPAFRVTDENLSTIIAICRAVDGVPLALELAAARIRTYSPEEILERLDSALTLLSSAATDLPERQRTIRQTIAWSTEQLDPAGRAALTELTVFDGPFSRDAAVAVLSDAQPEDALDLLVDASLVQQRDDGGARVFALLSLVRTFARPEPADPDVVERWIGYFTSFAARAEEAMAGPGQLVWLQRLTSASGNITAVMRALLNGERLDEAAELAWSLYLFGWISGRLGVQHAWMRELVDRARGGSAELSPRTEAIALYYTNAIGFWQADSPDVSPGLRRSAELFERAGDRHGAALAMVSIALAQLAAPAGPDVSGATATLDRAEADFRAAGDSWGEAMTLVTRGRIDLALGDLPGALGRFERSLTLATENRERLGMVIAQNHRGWARFLGGDLDGAEQDFADGLDVSRSFHHEEGVAYALDGIAAVAAMRGRATDAGTLLGFADELRRRHGIVNSAGFRPHAAAIDALRAGAQREEFDAARSRGGTLSIAEVMDVVRG